MKPTTTRIIRGWLRDMALGAVIFLMMPVASHIVAGPQQRWSVSEALARELGSHETIDVATFAGTLFDFAVAMPMPTQVVPDPNRTRQMSDWVVLGLTFSLLVAFNLAFVRHLRRVSASRRRD